MRLKIVAIALALSPVFDAPSMAQDYPDRPPPGYDAGDQRGFQPPPADDGDGPPPPPPPSGYDGSQPPPPPPGYRPDTSYAPRPQDDRRYEAYAEDWAERYCVKSRSDAGAGAVIGGLFGALLGTGIAGRHDRGAGAVIGGIAGAAGGAAIGSTTEGRTSPGCPPGFVARGDAPAFYYDGGPYLYAAPAWYRPWYYDGDRWLYRPYPYHVWYYRNYGYGRPYWRGYGRSYSGGGYYGGYYYGRGFRRGY